MDLGRKGMKAKVEEKPVLDICAVLSHYGMDAPATGVWSKFKCHGERKASASVNSSIGVMSCFSCGLKGDALAVIRQLDSCDFRGALAKYKEITGEDAPGFGDKSTRNHHGSVTSIDRASYEESGSWLASKLRKAN